MDSNIIKKDGFSNPATQRLFESWSEDQVWAGIDANQECGTCLCALFLVDAPGDFVWVLCLNEKSPHFCETVNWAFRCPQQERNPSVENQIRPTAMRQ